VKDGENYTVLLNQLKPDQCSLAPLKTTDLHTRAEQVLTNADNIGCRKYLTPASLLAGNPRLNLAFVANLFNTHPGLEPLDEQEAKDYGVVDDFDAEGEREARVFTLWLNSLGVEPSVFNLFNDLRDGLVIIQAFDKIGPGSVVWRRVAKPKEGGVKPYVEPVEGEEGEDIGVTPNQPTLSRFKCVENCNYSVELGRQSGMHLVGIQGADIVDGNKTLVLGLVWQLMRMNISKTLQSLSKGGQGRPVSDQEILRWANTTVQKGKPGARTLRSFKDPWLTTGIFFLDLLEALRPGIVDPSMIINVNETGDYESRRQNGTFRLTTTLPRVSLFLCSKTCHFHR
jgi:plastin-1